MILLHGQRPSISTLKATILHPYGTRTEKCTSLVDMPGKSCTYEKFLDIRKANTIYGSPGILLAEANLETGEVGRWEIIWNGTGGTASSVPLKENALKAGPNDKTRHQRVLTYTSKTGGIIY